jgi:hypothetical protein
VPIARYLIFVGCTLIALLLIAGWCLPTPPAMFADQQLAMDRAVIRIKSARKWPEKIVLDTSRPTMAPRAIEEPPAAQSVQRLADEPGDQSNLQALAQPRPDTTSAAVDHPTLRAKRGLARTVRLRPVARTPVIRRQARAEAGGSCCQFGWVDNGQTSWKAMSRKHASSWPMDWPAITGRD